MEIHFTAEDWARIRRDYQAWWDGKLDRPLVFMHSVAVKEHRQFTWASVHRYLAQYPPQVPPEQVVEAFIERQAARRFVGDTFPYMFINFGAGILAAFLGCKVGVEPETVWFDPQEGADLESLPIKFDTEGYWWRRVLDITTAAVERIGHLVQVSHADLGGNADILASLVGSERLLMDLIDRPKAVLKALAGVRRAWLDAYDRLYAVIRQRCPGTVPWAPIWAPGTGYMLQSDFCYMISPAMFEEFVLPDLVESCEHLQYPFYHLDGVGQLPHVQMLLDIKKLRGIQWIPGDGKPPADQWLDLLCRIRDGGKIIQLNIDADGARRICKEIGGRGMLFAIWGGMSPQQAQDYYNELLDLSAAAKG